MTDEEKELIFTRLCQMQAQIDGLEETQRGLIKRLQDMVFDRLRDTPMTNFSRNNP